MLGNLANVGHILGVFGVIGFVPLNELLVCGCVDLVGGAVDGSKAASQEGLPEAMGILGKIGQAHEAAKRLPEDGPRFLFGLEALGQTQAHSFQVANDAVGTEQLEVVGLVLGAALCNHGRGIDGSAEAGAAVVQKQDLVASVESNLGEGVILGLAVPEAGPALKIDEIGQRILFRELGSGQGKDGTLVLCDTAAEEL